MTTESHPQEQKVTTPLSAKTGPGLWIDAKIMAKTHLTLAQRAVLGNLVFRRWENGKCCPTNETIASDLGVSRPTVVRAIKKLKAAHEIAVDSAHGGIRQANQYVVLDPNLAHQNEARDQTRGNLAHQNDPRLAHQNEARDRNLAHQNDPQNRRTRENLTKQQGVVGGKARAGESKRGAYPKREKTIDEIVMPHLKQRLPQIAGEVTFDDVFEALDSWPSEQVLNAIGKCNAQTRKWEGVEYHLKTLPQWSPAQKKRQEEIIRQNDPLAASQATAKFQPLPDDHPVAPLVTQCVKTPNYGHLAVN